MFDFLLSGIPELLPHFETAHLTALISTLILGFIIIISTKVKSSNQFTGIVSAVLAIFLITCYPAKIISRTLDGIPLDKDSILKSINKTGCIVSAEEHNFLGGLGESISRVLVENNPVPQEFVATNDTFGESGTPSQLMEKYGIDSKAIIKSCLKVINRKKN